ncbi:hypothetical protein OG225_22345 [Nocardia sp. NBC_01377]|uniref:hypothetical protein n=1 Tax=Nocardia sp. NBC_01377 TaxID=2903595 RepID=UPI003252DE21
MRRTMSALVVLVLALVGGGSTAAADPESGSADADSIALLTLTTIPGGWQERTDLRPILEVFADGRAIKKPDAASAERKPETPPQQLEGKIRPDVVRSALTEIKELATLDLGTPSITDHGTQIIDLMPQPPEQTVHLIVYAPDLSEGLTTDQQSARKRFADLYRTLLDAFVKN